MNPDAEGEFSLGCFWAMIGTAFFWIAVVLLWWVLQEAAVIPP